MVATNHYLSYEQTDCCPLCGSKHFTVGVERKEISQSIPMPSEQIHQQAVVKFTPALCEHCGLSFNVTGLSNLSRDYIYRNYQFILPSQGVGAGNYVTFIEEVKKHLKSHEDKVLDIGGLDGFLLRQLKEQGYQNLTLIDPSAKTEGLDPSIQAITGFFPQDEGVYQARMAGKDIELYDVIGTKDVVQMLPDLPGFFTGLNAVLKTGGIAVCTSVPLEVMHSLQCSHLGLNAYHYLAQNFGFELVESYKKPENGYIVYVLKKVLDLHTASAKQIATFKTNAKQSPEAFKAEQDKQRTNLNSKGFFSPEMCQKINAIMQHCASLNQEIVIYGTGFYTFGILDALECDYHKLKLNLVNSSADHEGYLYMLPDSSTMEVHYANHYLKDRHIDLLVLGVLSPIFKAEILENLKSINCTCKQVLYLPDLQ